MSMLPDSNDTPMIKQYKEIKAQHQDCILMFRLGDFYEMFYDDAKLASRILELTLTARGKTTEGAHVPMCGIPYHAANNYIPRLINKGYKVAICEQTEDPAASKGITKREVVKIVTPGTVTETTMLDSKSNNYLMAVYQEDKSSAYGIAYIDVSTGDFYVSQAQSEKNLKDEISRVNPSEILMTKELSQLLLPTITIYEAESIEKSQKALLDFFNINSLESFGCQSLQLAFPAVKAIINYVSRTQKTNIGHINRLTPYLSGKYMFFDVATRRNLELNTTMREKDKTGSLLWVLDKTRTAMGGRLLAHWVASPLLDYNELITRQEAVTELFKNYSLQLELGEKLKSVYDIERITTRIASMIANPKEIRALCTSLKQAITIKELIKDCISPMIATMLSAEDINKIDEIIEVIDTAIVDDPPIALKDGGIIREGYFQELDDIRLASRDGKAWIAALELKEKESTGIKSLKVGYNKVFGYYLEVTNANISQVPDYYIRKQTLTNGERYITPELKEKESQILNAADQALELEYKVFTEIRDAIAKYILPLQKAAKSLAQLDVMLSFAEAAIENNYTCPTVYPMDENQGILRVKAARHPVIEKTINSSNFIPNDVDMDSTDNRFMILTGPNMAGKSTYMRQIALIVLLAQIGSYVPAQSAELTMVDRIFTRVGAMDDLFSGQSTFMVEMNETANILHNATKYSLVILDEIGRGTSTYDGMSIAAAVAEHIHMNIGAKTIFATHYHELTGLTSQYHGMNNFNIAVAEEDDHVVFLRKVIPGAADKSYGIHVAQLAGLPINVISRAKELLFGLEENTVKINVEEVKQPRQLGLF